MGREKETVIEVLGKFVNKPNGSQSRSPGAGRVAEKRQSALAMITESTHPRVAMQSHRQLVAVDNICQQAGARPAFHPRFLDRFASASSVLVYLQRSCIRMTVTEWR